MIKEITEIRYIFDTQMLYEGLNLICKYRSSVDLGNLNEWADEYIGTIISLTETEIVVGDDSRVNYISIGDYTNGLYMLELIE